MQISEILTLANSLTVLQTYRPTLSIPQTNCTYRIFLCQVEYGIYCSQLEYGIFPCQVVNPVFKLRAKIPVFKSINFISSLTWPGFELKTVWNRQEIVHFFKALCVREREKRKKEKERWEEGAQVGQYIHFECTHLCLSLSVWSSLSPSCLSFWAHSLMHNHQKLKKIVIKKFAVSGDWTHNLLHCNTCLHQLSYWNRQKLK